MKAVVIYTDFVNAVRALGPNHPVGWATELAIYRQLAEKHEVTVDAVMDAVALNDDEGEPSVN